MATVMRLKAEGAEAGPPRFYVATEWAQRLRLGDAVRFTGDTGERSMYGHVYRVARVEGSGHTRLVYVTDVAEV